MLCCWVVDVVVVVVVLVDVVVVVIVVDPYRVVGLLSCDDGLLSFRRIFHTWEQCEKLISEKKVRILPSVNFSNFKSETF